MTPGTKRTIITSKTTGRRYFLVRSSNRPSGRRYYLCSNPLCKARVSREADLYCRLHAQGNGSEGATDPDENSADVSMKSEQNNENDQDGLISTSLVNESISSPGENPKTNGNHSLVNGDSHSSSPSTERQVEVNDETGVRSFRDHSGRRRFLCMQNSCPNILQRQSDRFCRAHSSIHDTVNKLPISAARRSLKRSSSSSLSKTSTSMPITDSPMQNSLADRPSKTTGQRPGTHRSFRDASGKIRFLCSIATCPSRVARQTDYFCRRHQLEFQNQTPDVDSNAVQNYETLPEDPVEIRRFIQNYSNQPDQTGGIETKRRKRQSSVILSSVPGNKINIATTTLLEDQWADVLTFLRHFSSVQLSTNLNITNATTHLLVDDSEHHLHCTITKKIVQAAVRRHVFIISFRWLKECLRHNAFVDEHPFEIISDSHTSLRLSQQDFQSYDQMIFPSNSSSIYAFAIECRQCQGSITRNELIELIHLTGAQLFQSEQAVDVLIVLCDSNDKNLNKIKEKYVHAPASTIKFVTSDFLLKSIIKFELQDIDKYAL